MSGEAALGMVMLVVMIGVIFIGFPISFTLLFLALSFGFSAFGDTVFNLAYYQTIGMMKEELLAAVPLFVFMGFLTEQAGLMERLFIAFRNILAPIRGRRSPLPRPRCSCMRSALRLVRAPQRCRPRRGS